MSTNAALKAENMVIGQMETNYFKMNFGQAHIACENLEFLWEKSQVTEFQQMWRAGYSIIEMAEYFERPQEEMMILALDQSIRGRIQPRENGIFGGQ